GSGPSPRSRGRRARWRGRRRGRSGRRPPPRRRWRAGWRARTRGGPVGAWSCSAPFGQAGEVVDGRDDGGAVHAGHAEVVPPGARSGPTPGTRPPLVAEHHGGPPPRPPPGEGDGGGKDRH